MSHEHEEHHHHHHHSRARRNYVLPLISVAAIAGGSYWMGAGAPNSDAEAPRVEASQPPAGLADHGQLNRPAPQTTSGGGQSADDVLVPVTLPTGRFSGTTTR